MGQGPWLWITHDGAVRDEILRLGVVDCLLWSEVTGPLLVHVLRAILRTIAAKSVTWSAPLICHSERKDRLQTLIQNIPGTVYRCLNTKEWHGMYFSEAIEALVGYPAIDFFPGGDRLFVDLIHPADREFVLKTINQRVEAKKPFALEYRLRHRDGSIKWVDERGQGVFDEQGNLLWLDGVIIDISEKKAIAKELNQQAIQYYEKTPAMLHSMDATGMIIAVSDRWLQVLGYDRRDVIGCSFTDFLVPTSRQDAQDRLFPALSAQEKIADQAYQLIKANGEILEVELSAICEQTDHFSRILVVLTDVTTRNHLAEQVTQYQTHLESLIDQRTQALAASEARLAQAQAIANIGVWEWDIAKNQTYWSPEAFRIYGFSPGEIQPNTETFFARIHPDDRDRVQKILAQVLAGEPGPSTEYRIITPAGETRYIKDYHEITRDDQGNPIYFGGAVQDITEMRQTLNALAASEARLAKSQAIAHVGSWEWSLSQNELIWSDEMYRIFDVEPQVVPPSFDWFLKMVHPEDRRRIQTALGDLNTGKRLYGFEYRIITALGFEKIVVEHVDPIQDDQGRVIRFAGTLQDITVFKRTMNALAASEARFRTIFDQAALGIVQIDNHDHFALVNQAFCHLLGYTAAELRELTWQIITHPDDLDLCRAPLAQLRAREINSAILEKRYYHRQGQIIWVKVICSYIYYDEQGEPEYLLAIIEDITAYKQAAIALAESQTRYQDIVEGIPAIVYQYSLQKGGIFYSSHLKNVLGYTPEFLLAHPELWHDSIHPEDLEKVDQLLGELGTRKKFEVEYRIRDAGGHWHWFYDCSFSVREIRGELIIEGFAMDITGRKNFDATLRHRLTLETLLADISHLMIVEADLDLQRVLAMLGQTFQADRMSVMLSRPRTNAVERLVAWSATPDLALDEAFKIIDLSPYPWWLQRWQGQQPITLNRDHPLPPEAIAEQTFLKQIGVKAVLWIPIQDQAGQPWGYIECSSTASDAPQWSKEDADILAIAGNLIYNYHQRHQANKQLEIAKELAEAANHAKNQFITSMSHELRTPLNAVLGFTQVLERSSNLRPEQQEYLNIIHRSGKHLLALLNDILNLAKFEKGTLQLNQNLFNLHALLDDLRHMYALEVQHKKLHLEIVWDEQVPRYINADQPKLHSVLLHLLNNALKFTEYGHIQLTVTTLSPDPLCLRFSVIDTGIGIAEVDFAKLFDNFVKLEAGDRLGQGSGLGLALSQKFVNLMGSEIVVSSQPGVGSCFSFELLCDTSALLPQFTLYPPQIDETATLSLTPEMLQDFAPDWLAAFHQAALAARAQQLKNLIAQLPPEAEAIAQSLTTLVQKFAFDTLASLSQEKPPNDLVSSKGEPGS
ncbi:MAG: PAS domain-containing protein [Synechococcus sp.]|nr:PAS domain-containing protein [Synechococcus sp.]